MHLQVGGASARPDENSKRSCGVLDLVVVKYCVLVGRYGWIASWESHHGQAAQIDHYDVCHPSVAGFHVVHEMILAALEEDSEPTFLSLWPQSCLNQVLYCWHAVISRQAAVAVLIAVMLGLSQCTALHQAGSVELRRA